jgi:tellurite resistance protein TerC
MPDPEPIIAHHVASWSHWVGFSTLIVAMLVVDLVLLDRRKAATSGRRALVGVTVWFALGLGVGGAIWWRFGHHSFVEYMTAYVVEESLSVDNMFVFAVMFSAFRIPPQHRHRVLFWGIFGALAMRAGFIFAGVALLERFHWLMYVFGAVLLVAAVRTGRPDDDRERERGGLVVRAIGRALPTTPTLHGDKFLIRDLGTHRLIATPLLVCLIALELTDIAFAIDSVPAVFGVTTDPFIVFTSNAMAILGLRSLYLAIAGGLARFRHLQTGLAVILGFIGLKMLAHDILHIPGIASLGVILAILAITAVWSWRDRTHHVAGPIAPSGVS